MAGNEIAALVSRVAELERRMAGTLRHGTVAEVDAGAQRVRLDLGPSDAGGRLLSPWVPYSQLAGAMRAHIPPTEGQQFTVAAPGGEWEQAVALPLTFSDHIPSPGSAPDENVVTFADARFTLRDGFLEIEVGGAILRLTPDAIEGELGGSSLRITADDIKAEAGGVTMRVSGDGIEVDGGDIKHNDTSVGDTHRHDGVATGPANTGHPIS